MKSTARKLYLKKRQPYSIVLEKIKQYKYRGFIIQLWKDKRYSFKYEYSIEPLTAQAKALMFKAKVTTLYDVTSHKFLFICKDSAKCRINELLSPLWMKY